VLFLLHLWYAADYVLADQLQQAVTPVLPQLQEQQQMQQLLREHFDQQQQQVRQQLISRMDGISSVMDALVRSEPSAMCHLLRCKPTASTLLSQMSLLQEHNRCIRVHNSYLGLNDPISLLQCSKLQPAAGDACHSGCSIRRGGPALPLHLQNMTRHFLMLTHTPFKQPMVS
jgi:hypothetical protein